MSPALQEQHQGHASKKTLTMFSTWVAKQQTTVAKTKDDLAKVAVSLQYNCTCLTQNIYPIIHETILDTWFFFFF